ncbi:MAG TPA: GxxExxY protein [Verrucomicrobiae bacterium]|nr:GxxExxY protein [Verrucomicrobiae bacterium]
MPVIIHAPMRRLSQAEFGELAYSVMRCVFQIHDEMGRLFDEKIYKRELAHRHAGVQLEVPIEVVHATFRKLQYLDVLVDGGGPFEFKAVEAIAPRHPAQLLHYMLLAELSHGKLVNLRKESVEHQFVNTTLRREDRIRFELADSRWNDKTPGAARFREALTALLRDWGTGLDLQLYEECLTHLLGGEARVLADVEVCSGKHVLGHQKLRLAAPRVAFALTTLPEVGAEYESHARRLLQHTGLEAILWANIGLKLVTVTTIA